MRDDLSFPWWLPGQSPLHAHPPVITVPPQHLPPIPPGLAPETDLCAAITWRSLSLLMRLPCTYSACDAGWGLRLRAIYHISTCLREKIKGDALYKKGEHKDKCPWTTPMASDSGHCRPSLGGPESHRAVASDLRATDGVRPVRNALPLRDMLSHCQRVFLRDKYLHFRGIYMMSRLGRKLPAAHGGVRASASAPPPGPVAVPQPDAR